MIIFLLTWNNNTICERTQKEWPSVGRIFLKLIFPQKPDALKTFFMSSFCRSSRMWRHSLGRNSPSTNPIYSLGSLNTWLPSNCLLSADSVVMGMILHVELLCADVMIVWRHKVIRNMTLWDTFFISYWFDLLVLLNFR